MTGRAIAGGIISRSPRIHAVGPYLYFERDGFILHAWARWFMLPYQHGWYWRLTLRWRGRYRMWGNG